MRSHLLLRRRPLAPRTGRQQQPLDKDGLRTGEQQATDSPFAEIQRIRKVKRVGIGLSAAFLGSAAAVAAGSGVVTPPPVELPVEAAATVSAALAAAAALTLAAAKLSLGEGLHVELEGPRLFVEVLPSFDAAESTESSGSSPPPPPFSRCSRRPDGRPFLVVRDTGDGRGLGVYVRGERGAKSGGGGGGGSPFLFLPRSSFLGCYAGDLLSEEQFWQRYPRGIGDYCMGCGGGFCLDGAPLAEELRGRERERERESRLGGDQEGGGEGAGGAAGAGVGPSSSSSPPYSPCLVNHSSKRANLSRITRRRERRVELYASRDVYPGEELLLDYGRKYWQGREAEEKD